MILAIGIFSISAFGAKYDFSNILKFGQSVEAQSKLEGIDNKVFAEKFAKYAEALAKKNAVDVANKIPADKRGTQEAKVIAVQATLEMFKKEMGDKSLRDILGLKEEPKPEAKPEAKPEPKLK